MKRSSLLKHLRRHGCVLKREGRGHSLWTNPGTGMVEAVPRHTEVGNGLARKICRGLGIPEVGSDDRAV
jgi:mRNA interferase HicA